MFSEPDRRIAAIARRQHGAFSRAQALSAGLTPRTISYRLSRAAWIRLDPAVYALPTHRPTWHRQLMAATLTAAGAAISGRPAAALHGIDGFPRGSLEITVPRSSRRSTTRLAVVRSSIDVEATRIDGIPCTTVERTLADLAGALGEREARRAVESAVVQRLTSLDQLTNWVDRSQHRCGSGRGAFRALLRDLCDSTEPPATSALEHRLRVLLACPTLPPFVFEREVPWWPEGEGRVDALCEPGRLIVEADGRRWHTREQDFENDRRRDNMAASHGHAVLRFTWNDLGSRGLEQSRALVAATLASRSMHL